ncbi:MAG: DUF4421 family protein [Cytophagia bacterium]|nr:DUF4421 family protein [Cytophagia bacterium]
MKRTLIVVIIAFSSFTYLSAQDIDSIVDSLVARRSITEKVTLKLSTYNSSEWFEVAGSNGQPGFDIRPNDAIMNRVGFNYRFLSFSYKFLISALPPNADDEEKGETTANGFNFALSPGQWATDFSWDKTKGYYLRNTDDFDNTWMDGDPYFQFPNLESQIFRARIGRVLNPEYSINAVTTQTEEQLASQGTFLPSLRLTYYTVNDKEPFGPNVTTTQRARQFEAIFSVGYLYTLVLGKGFYTSVDLRPGLGYLNTGLLTRFANANDIETNTDHFVTGFDTDLQLGYNSSKFFTGIRGSYDHYEHDQYETSAARITNERLRVEFFFGIRLKAPEQMKANLDKAEANMLKYMVKRKLRREERKKQKLNQN